MSSEFVKKMKDKFKEAALRRIEAWKESADAVVDEHHSTCPICFHVYTLAVEDCSMGVLQMPLPDGADPTYKANERPYPSCRSPVCEEKLCEPTDKDLAGDADQEQRPKTFKTFNPKRDKEEKDVVGDSKKRLGKRRATTIVDSDDEIEEDLPEEKELDSL
ncbi:hypothetical protein FB45DRAFT_1044375 [Roridomyces roridus]|uniref:Uncharacterized protein n=1 Tax=Roridomyces roridus TaxID=1738132 RepID=A0AAD7F609_9AGAR|nr:hypothetical protein FB45DRAFT_1044375 [Roridomyces roridus]